VGRLNSEPRERELEGVARPRVLIAEDHADTRDALKLLLELQGYDVLAARDGEEALALALEVKPDVIITDFDMPRLDGAGLARELRAMSTKFDDVPILVLTALNQTMVERAMEAGANAYIAKPVDFKTLELTLRVFVGRA
jgi:CheY-like chemotaxis protein